MELSVQAPTTKTDDSIVEMWHVGCPPSVFEFRVRAGIINST
jgi:hypothetical protein